MTFSSGSPVRDLDVVVYGNALKLKKALEKSGAHLWGEHEPSRTLFFRFPGGVTVEIASARSEEYPKPCKPVYHWSSIYEDLRRRDFTANAMALSLNEHSYGLLMDPLNGIADIEGRILRLVSNYGFIEDPARLLRATRLAARLGWDMDERTKARYQTAKDENYVEALSAYQRGYELEEIAHEEDGLRILGAMQAEGWMKYLEPAWTTSQADTAKLQEMHKLLTQLQMQGVNPDFSAVSIQLLTAKLQGKTLSAIKKMFVRPGFVEEWDNLDNAAKQFAKQLTGKEAATPSATWKLFHSADPQAILWLGLTSKVAPIQAKYKNFFTVWPEARQKVPHALMQELRITPSLPAYEEMLNQLFFAVIDGKVETEEQLRAFLQPYSPPAPPPPVVVRRGRGGRKSSDVKSKGAAAAGESAHADARPEDDGLKPAAAATSAGKKTAAGKKAAPKTDSKPDSKIAVKVVPAKPAAPAKLPATKTVSRGVAAKSAPAPRAAGKKASPAAKNVKAKIVVKKKAEKKSPAKAPAKKAAKAASPKKAAPAPKKSKVSKRH